MSDLKEETALDNNDSGQVVEETVERPSPRPIDPNLQGIQLFYEKNKKMVNYVAGGVFALVAAIALYQFYYIPEQEKEAANEIYWAQTAFERDSFNVALKGGPMVLSADGQKSMLGFEAIAENYSMTKTGSLANYYAGICCLRTQKFAEAIEFFQNYDGDDAIISSIAIGAIGDCNIELNNVDNAIKYYLKAAENNVNSFTTPLYLKKAGFAYELKSNYAKALQVYERIKKEYGNSELGKEIDREIAKVKAAGKL
jgi:tetratricopeptide (TPR) repeat protein